MSTRIWMGLAGGGAGRGERAGADCAEPARRAPRFPGCLRGAGQPQRRQSSACRGSSEVDHLHTNASAAGTAFRVNGRHAVGVFANSKALATTGAVGVLARVDRIMAAL
jgi:hypothetical protein